VFGVLHRYNAWEAGELLSDGTWHPFPGRYQQRSGAVTNLRHNCRRLDVKPPWPVPTLTLPTKKA